VSGPKLEKLFAERVKFTDPTGVLVLGCQNAGRDHQTREADAERLAHRVRYAQVAGVTAMVYFVVSISLWQNPGGGSSTGSLVELIGPHMGQPDMELDKLAVFAGALEKDRARATWTRSSAAARQRRRGNCSR
jgi:hypothetical protein